MANFATTSTPVRLHLTGRETGKVVVQHKLRVALGQRLVHNLLVELGAERGRGQALGFATSEDGRAMRTGQVIYFRPDRADFGELAAIETHPLLDHHITNGLLLGRTIVAAEHLHVQLGIHSQQVLQHTFFHLRETLLAAAFTSVAATGHIVSTLVYCVENGLFQCLIFFVLRIFASRRIDGAAHGFGQLLLHLALGLDGFVTEGNGSDHFLFAHLLHGSFHHGHGVGSSTYHQIHVGAGEIRGFGVNLKLAIDARHAHFRNRAGKRNVGNRQRSRGSQSGQGIGLHFFISRDEGNHHLHLIVVVFGEHRPQDAVDEAANQDFVVTQAAFPALERAGNLAGRAEFFLVIHR